MKSASLRAVRPTLVRRTYQIRPDQDTAIQERRLATGDSWSVIVRRLIDQALAAEATEMKVAQKRRVRS